MLAPLALLLERRTSPRGRGLALAPLALLRLCGLACG